MATPTLRFLFRRYEIFKNVSGGESFLEAGCGNLELSSELLDHYKQGVGVEFSGESEQFYEDWDDTKQSRYKLLQEDFVNADLPFQNNFDLFIASEVMEHVKEDLKFLQKGSAYLRPGAKVIITVPAKQKYWSYDDELVGHIKRYEIEDLKDIFEKSDIELEEVISYGFPFTMLLRKIRTMVAKKDLEKVEEMSLEDRSKKSGISPFVSILKAISPVINKYTLLPLNIISTLFNKLHLTDGYIAIGKKI